MSYRDLDGLTFIVTGAASGIARATAILLAKQGANLGILDLQRCDETLAEVEKAGGRALAFLVDVNDLASVESAVRETAQQFGDIAGAANLAGWVGNQGWRGKAYALDTINNDDWDAMIGTNLSGVKNCIKAELRYFRREGGSIVNAASVAGQRGTPNNSPYSVSKAGVIALSKCAAQETGSRAIRVNAIAPGIIETPMAAALGDHDQLHERLVSRTALKRFGQANEVAQVILFLLSNVSAYITSSVLNVDGGYQ